MSSDSLQSLINLIARTPAEVTRLISDLSSQDLRRTNTPEEFSALENICHLRDIETEGYEVRIARILEESNPLLTDIDGSRLAIERAYNNQDPQSALKDFADARHRNIQRMKNLSLEQLELEGTLEGVGRVTLGRLVEMMSEHDEGHLHELSIIQRRYRGAAAT
jgi:DinB superfamily